MTDTGGERRPLTFFALTLALAAPFWVFGLVVTPLEGVPLDLPWTALVFVVPAVAAVLLVHRESGLGGVRELLRQSVDVRRIGPVWLVAALVLMPVVVMLSGVVLDMLGVPPRGTYSGPAALPVLFVGYLVPAWCEEVGWSGYATQPARRRWGTPAAALVIGVAWVAMHVIPWLQVHGLVWTLGYSAFSVVARVVIVWVFVSTGQSVIAAVLLHDMINTSASLSSYTGSPVAPYLWAVVGLAVVGALRFFLKPGTAAPEQG